MINQPDVALTDLAIAIESGMFAYLMWRRSGRHQPLARWFILFFLAAGVGALAGGTVHGFFPDERSPLEHFLWPTTLIALGAAAMAAWAIGALIGFDERWRRRIIRVAQLEFVLYAGVIIFGSRAFVVAILNNLPAAIFLLMVFAIRWLVTRNRGFLVGALAMIATFLAAIVQRSHFAPEPNYLSYNALYHLIQAAALLMLFAAAQCINGPAES